jgi:U3 small nucleolar RNA-associated protein 4
MFLRYQNYDCLVQEEVANCWNGAWRSPASRYVLMFFFTLSLSSCSHQRTIGSQGGAIWCVAANPASTFLALGCEDGTVRLLSVVNDTLTHYRRFDRVNCRMLSIAWGPPVPRSRPQSSMNEDGSDSDSDDDEDDWQDSWLVTGCSDSSLRKWDVKTGRPLERMAVDKIRGERTLVWTVGTLG